jgi:hypothetical protein
MSLIVFFQKKKKPEAGDLHEDELLGELLGEIKSSSAMPKKNSQPLPRLPKSCPAPKPVSGPVNPFRSTGIRRPKRPLATNDSDNFDDVDVNDFGDSDVIVKEENPSQTIEDFPESMNDADDFDESELMEIEEAATQEIEKEKENR